MAQSNSGGGGGPTHYEILSITPKHLEGQSDPSQTKVIKKAYHRALLRHHPDKANASGSSNNNNKSTSSSTSTTTTTTIATYTVDQIQEAYSVLSDSKRRTEYNRTLFQKTANNNNNNSPSSPHLSNANNRNGNNNSNNSNSTSKSTATATATTWSFRTGVETVDLDDLGFDERTGVYYRSCRCGNARAYRFEDGDLEECEDEGVLMVECLDCSLWLRVLFAPAGGDDDGHHHHHAQDEEKKSDEAVVNHHHHHQQQQQQQSNRGEVAASGERRGGGETSRGFRFNWSFSWGISVGGSANASSSSALSRGNGG